MSHHAVAALFVILKGAILGLVATALIGDFAKAIVLALVSAGIGAVGVVVAAVLTARMDRERYEMMLEDLKRAQGLTRRQADPNADDNTQ